MDMRFLGHSPESSPLSMGPATMISIIPKMLATTQHPSMLLNICLAPTIFSFRHNPKREPSLPFNDALSDYLDLTTLEFILYLKLNKYYKLFKTTNNSFQATESVLSGE